MMGTAKEVLRMRLRGGRLADIGHKFDILPSRVLQMIGPLEPYGKGVGEAHQILILERNEAIRELRADGTTLKDIGELYRISASRVHVICHPEVATHQRRTLERLNG